jgi:phosphoribosylamine-glycine ligase
LAEARQTAYDAVGKISWPGLHHRNDIASDAAVDRLEDRDRRANP